MYGLAVNLIVSVSGHPWIINEIMQYRLSEFFRGGSLLLPTSVIISEQICDVLKFSKKATKYCQNF